MSEVLERFRRVADELSARVDAVPADAWENQCPSCPDWTARQLMTHVIENAQWGLNTIHDVEHEPIEYIADVPAEWARVRAAVEEALADPELSVAGVLGPLGPTPYEELIRGVGCADMLIHTWDLARATGGDEKLDPQLSLETLEFLLPMEIVLRRPGMFKKAVTPPNGSDVVTALISFCGRKV
jgi:uncharacterized protein (TIGR03086 family)